MPDPTINDRQPNFRNEEGKLYLVRCFACDDAGPRGRENWAMVVSQGYCAWCGWHEDTKCERSDGIHQRYCSCFYRADEPCCYCGAEPC